MAHDIHARSIAQSYAAGREHIRELVRRDSVPLQPLPAASWGKKTLPPPKNAVAGIPGRAIRALKATLPPPKGNGGIDSSKVYAAPSLFDNTDILPGMVRRDVGVVFIFNGSEYAVVSTSPPSSKCICLQRVKRTVTNGMTGETVEFMDSPGKLTVSNQIEPSEIVRVMTPDEIANFQPSKSRTEGLNTKQQTGIGEINNMKTAKELTGIDALVSKAIASKKDDNKITAMCLANYPEVAAGDVVKLIAKHRKAAAKGVPAPAPKVPAAKAAAPTPKAKAAKAEGSARPETPSAEHPWAGCGAAMRKLIAAEVAPAAAFNKLAKTYLKMTPGSFAGDWKRFTGTKPDMTGAKVPARGFNTEATAPAPKAKAPAPKTADPAAKKLPPVKAPAPVEETAAEEQPATE